MLDLLHVNKTLNNSIRSYHLHQELPPNKSGRSFEGPIQVTSRGPTHSSFDKDETDLVQDARCRARVYSYFKPAMLANHKCWLRVDDLYQFTHIDNIFLKCLLVFLLCCKQLFGMFQVRVCLNINLWIKHSIYEPLSV